MGKVYFIVIVLMRGRLDELLLYIIFEQEEFACPFTSVSTHIIGTCIYMILLNVIGLYTVYSFVLSFISPVKLFRSAFIFLHSVYFLSN